MTWEGEMLLFVDVVPDVCILAFPAAFAFVECCEDADEDGGEWPTAPPPPPVEGFAAEPAAADELDGVFGFELRICAQVGFEGDG